MCPDGEEFLLWIQQWACVSSLGSKETDNVNSMDRKAECCDSFRADLCSAALQHYHPWQHPHFLLRGGEEENVKNLKIKKNQRLFVDLSIWMAKRGAALSWRNIRGPRVSRRLSERSSTLPLEEITSSMKLQQHHLHQIWDPLFTKLQEQICVMEESWDMKPVALCDTQ